MSTIVGVRPTRRGGWLAKYSSGRPEFISAATAQQLLQRVPNLGYAPQKVRRVPKVRGSYTKARDVCGVAYRACKLAAPHGQSRHDAYLRKVRAAAALRASRKRMARMSDDLFV